MPSGLAETFFSAFQASISVLLTVIYGVIASHLNLLSEAAGRDISKTCIRLFLPALLIADVGSQLRLETATRYIPIIIWGIFYNLASLVIGRILTRVMKLPRWVALAIAFNNTTSLPLLLIQSLQVTGVLSILDPSPDVIDRVKSYFLVASMVGNSLTFTFGPGILKESDHSDDRRHLPQSRQEDDEDVNEQTSLLSTAPKFQLPWYRQIFKFISKCYNPPVVGTVIGCVIGLVPSLHRLFFNKPDDGGYLRAWLTVSIKNLGDLFPALQILVIGLKLGQSLTKMRKGEGSGSVPWRLLLSVSLIRFVIWPLISIAFIGMLASKTGWLSSDPILWFALMLMPIGPPALKIMALAEVETDDEEEKMSIAKFLTFSYIITPFISLSVVGSLRVCQIVAGTD